MNQPPAEPFFASERSQALTHPALIRTLFERYPEDSKEFYDLTFYGSFAAKVFLILQREGPNAQGYEQMQQSFKESVRKISTIIDSIEPELRQAIMDILSNNGLQSFLADLAILKDWINART